MYLTTPTPHYSPATQGRVVITAKLRVPLLGSPAPRQLKLAFPAGKTHKPVSHYIVSSPVDILPVPLLPIFRFTLVSHRLVQSSLHFFLFFSGFILFNI